MTPYEAYCCHRAIRHHFQTPSYDYFEKQGKLKNTVTGYRNCDAKRMYKKLSDHRDPKGVILANVLVDRGEFVADLINCEGIKRYTEWSGRVQAGTYHFREEVEQLSLPFVKNIKVIDGQHPPLFTRYAKGKFSLENLIVINELTGCFEYWNKELLDPIYWPKQYQKFVKYRPFVRKDFSKYRQVLLDLHADKC
jgi:hypothetical protein